MERGDIGVLILIVLLIVGIQQIFGLRESTAVLPIIGILFVSIIFLTILVYMISKFILNTFDEAEPEDRLVAQFSFYHAVIFLILLFGSAIGIPPPSRDFAFRTITKYNIVLLLVAVNIYSVYRVFLSQFYAEEPELRRRLIILFTTNLVPYTLISMLYLLLV